MKMMDRFKNELGVTMVTVLFIGAVLTTVATTAAVVTVQEFHQGDGDRKATAALAYAEAGVDRLMLELRRGNYTFGQIRTAGCTGPTPIAVSGNVGGLKNTFSAQLTVYNSTAAPANRMPPAACAGRSDHPRTSQEYAIVSVGERLSSLPPTKVVAARKVVRQVVTIKSLDLPIGIFADNIDANGAGSVLSVSMVSPGDITGREKIGFTGNDPYYTKNDFYQNGDTAQMPAAAHAAGQIYYVTGGKNKTEHPPSPNCDANPRGTAGQSVFDGSNWTTNVASANVTTGCGHAAGFPPTSLFTDRDLARVAPKPNLSEQDYNLLRDAAKQNGLYCTPSGVNFTCLREGGGPYSLSSVVQTGDLGTLPQRHNFIAYFDFPSGGDVTKNVVKWKAEVKPCSDDPAVHHSVVLIVRNGSIGMQSGAYVTGAVLVPEGIFDSAGSYTVHGTVIADEFRLRGTDNLELSPCWVRNIPGPFLDVTPTTWSEIDR